MKDKIWLFVLEITKILDKKYTRGILACKNKLCTDYYVWRVHFFDKGYLYDCDDTSI